MSVIKQRLLIYTLSDACSNGFLATSGSSNDFVINHVELSVIQGVLFWRNFPYLAETFESSLRCEGHGIIGHD